MSEKRFDRLEEKLDRLDSRLDKIDITLVAQHEQITYHIRRTDLLESQVKPVADHVTFLKVALKWLAALAVVAGLLKALSGP